MRKRKRTREAINIINTTSETVQHKKIVLDCRVDPPGRQGTSRVHRGCLGESKVV